MRTELRSLDLELNRAALLRAVARAVCAHARLARMHAAVLRGALARERAMLLRCRSMLASELGALAAVGEGAGHTDSLNYPAGVQHGWSPLRIETRRQSTARCTSGTHPRLVR